MPADRIVIERPEVNIVLREDEDGNVVIQHEMRPPAEDFENGSELPATHMLAALMLDVAPEGSER